MSDIFERLPEESSLSVAFIRIAKNFPELPVYYQAQLEAAAKHSSPKRTWISENYTSLLQKICKLSQHLCHIGVKKGDSIAIVSGTRPEWLIADFAIQFAGAVSVPVYPSSSPDETAFVLYDSGSQYAFVENQEQLDKLAKLSKSPVHIPRIEDRPPYDSTLQLKRVISFESITAPLEDVWPVDSLKRIFGDESLSSEIPDSVWSLYPSDTVALVYTSGTTGTPKGVVQNHKNILCNVWQVCNARLFLPTESLFLLLPLAHSFARLIGYVGFLTETSLTFPTVLDNKRSTFIVNSIFQDLRHSQAQVIPVVPRILEKILSNLRQKSYGITPSRLFLRAALWSSIRVNEAKARSEAPGFFEQLFYDATDKLRQNLKYQIFGPSFRYIMCGGAKLDSSLARKFEALEIPICEGYGLTEASVAINANKPETNKVGSVGPTFKKIEIRMAEDGEILVRGPNVASRYHNRPKATQETWDEEGWLHTGDLGELDEDGYLFITDRKKDLIVTSSGKKISPYALESKLLSSDLIESAAVFGDQKPYLGALVAINKERVEKILRRRKVRIKVPLHKHDYAYRVIAREINRINKSLSHFEWIKEFRIVPEEFSPANGLLTPSYKLKRKVVHDRYSELVEDMFKNP